MRRISVVGSSGSGKSTLAKRLAETLDVPWIELDALHWGPGWTPVGADELRTVVQEAVAGEAWVVDGNYHALVGTLVWERADTVVWVDRPRRRVMWQVLARTVRRVVTRRKLWNGNRESWRGLMFWRDEADSILAWAWAAHPRVRERMEVAMHDPQHAGLAFRRLESSRDIERFIASLTDRDQGSQGSDVTP